MDHIGLRVLPKRTRRDGSILLATSDSASRDKHRESVGSPGSCVVISGGSARAGKARGGPVAWRLGLVVALTVAMASGADAATARAGERVACHGDARAGISSVKVTGGSAPSCSRILTLLRMVSGRVVLGGGRVDGWTCRWVLGEASCTHGQVTVAASYADTANCAMAPVAVFSQRTGTTGPFEIDVYGAPPPTCTTVIDVLGAAVSSLPVNRIGAVDGWRCVWSLNQAGCERGNVSVFASNPGD
jgi:hypothetical protein